MKHVKLLRAQFGKKLVFTARDVKMLLGKKTSSKYLNLLLHNLVKSGELNRISKGTYTFRSEVQLVGFAFQPFYYGLQDALSLRNLWEQETNAVVITPRRVRKGIRTFLGSNYLVRTIDRKMFFGFELAKYFDIWIPVSTPEKTLIDFVYFREPLSKDALKELKKKINEKILKEFLKRTSKRTRETVLKLLKK